MLACVYTRIACVCMVSYLFYHNNSSSHNNCPDTSYEIEGSGSEEFQTASAFGLGGHTLLDESHSKPDGTSLAHLLGNQDVGWVTSCLHTPDPNCPDTSIIFYCIHCDRSGHI